MLQVSFTLKSKNAKTGPIPVSMTAAQSCPTSCPMNNPTDPTALRCYAQKGPLSWTWSKLTKGTIGMQWGEFCATVAALPEGTLWRHNQSGDLPGHGDVIDGGAIRALAEANRGRKGFTYTHKPVDTVKGSTLHRNLQHIASAVAEGFAVNLSGNDLAHADALADAAETIAAPEARPHVVCVVPADHPERSTTPAGRPVIVCPEQTGKARNCAECGLCARMDRKPIVAFRAH
jgi:hypothetical protein